MSINKVFLSGNLTRDAEVRVTASGTAVLHAGMAVNDRVKDGDGKWTDRPNFVDLVMFGRRAEKLQPYLAKGAKVAIEGRLRWSQWESDGQKRNRLEVVVDDVELMSHGRSAQQGDDAGGLYDADIPF